MERLKQMFYGGYALAAIAAVMAAFAFGWLVMTRTDVALIPMAGFSSPLPIPIPVQPEETDLTIGGVPVRAYVADTPALRASGLSGYRSLPPGRGMLFVFETDGKHAFWMKDMLFPIDIIWADAARSVVHIEHSVAPESYPDSFMPDLPARYVLEVPAGFATEHGIGIGSKLGFSL